MTVTLAQLVEGARVTAERDRHQMPDAELRSRLRDSDIASLPGGRIRAALATPGLQVIAEVKGASPVDGILRDRLDPASLARTYAQAGAAAISVLTEESFFAGRLSHLQTVAGSVSVPVLRKDFITDAYQVRQAALAGAAGVLLIAETLESKQLVDLVGVCHELRLDALVEIHGLASLPAAGACGSGLLGVNNRNLDTMEVDWRHCLQVASELPAEAIRVAESGIADADQLAEVVAAGYDAVLIGTSLVTSADPGDKLRSLLAGVA